MKHIKILILFFFTACNNTSLKPIANKPLNSKEITIPLKDTLGNIVLTIPTRYDTLLIWTHFTDYSGGHLEKYRLQPKKLPIYEESGWISGSLSDSVDQITIEHYKHLRIPDTSDTFLRKAHTNSLTAAKLDATMYKVTFDTLQKINNKLFSIIASENYDTLKKVYSKQLRAATILKGNILRLTYSLLTKVKDSITDNFIPNSEKLLQETLFNGL